MSEHNKEDEMMQEEYNEPIRLTSENPCLYIRKDGLPDEPFYGNISVIYNGEVPNYDPRIEKIILYNNNLIVESRSQDILNEKEKELRAYFRKEVIYSKYSSERQKNIISDALPLIEIKCKDSSKLTPEQLQIINKHDEMNIWINGKRQKYAEIFKDLEAMNIEDLINFDIENINE